tara:strand:+ start:289 stop:1377 length:1089 start_codon:yes stop_codon:yes gene_type:complete
MQNGIMGVAQQMQRLGRDGDTILAHINPREMQALMNMGGRGSINPATGLPEFAPIDPLYYLSVNPQVMQQARQSTIAAGIQPGEEFQANMFRIAQDHYDAFGEAEGRAPDASLAPGPSTDFDAEFYAARNPDVVAAYGDDPRALVNHYLQFGVADTVFSGDDTQGRLGNPNQVVDPPSDIFDGAYYAANNPDVVAVYSNAPDRLYRHFRDYGQAEGRLGKAPSTTVEIPEIPQVNLGTGNNGGGVNLVSPPAIPDGRAYSPRVSGDEYQPVDYSGLNVTPRDTIDLLANQGVGVRYYIMVLNQNGQMVKEYVPANTPGAIREVTGVYGSTGRGSGMHDFYPNELGFIPEELDVSGILGLDPE